MDTNKLCPKCGKKINANDVFCPHCGKNLITSTKCPVCGNEMNGAKFCSKCGYSVTRNSGEMKGKISANAKKTGSFIKKHKKIFIIIVAVIVAIAIIVPTAVSLSSPFRQAKVNKVELGVTTKEEIKEKFGTPTDTLRLNAMSGMNVLSALQFIGKGKDVWVYYESKVSKKIESINKKAEQAEDFDELDKLYGELEKATKNPYKSIVVAFTDEGKVSFIALNTKTKYDDTDMFATTEKKELKSVEISENIVALNSSMSENDIIYTAKFKDGSMVKSYVSQVQGYDSSKAGAQKITFSDGWAEYTKNIEVKAPNVTVAANIDGVSVSGGGYYKNGEQVTVNAPETYGENYEFYAWYKDESEIVSTEKSYTFTVNGYGYYYLTAEYRDKYVFYGTEDKTITSVIIPDGITSIKDRAFYGCDRLTSVTIPDSVTSIGWGAFEGCPIETANIPAFACSYIAKSSLETVVITSGENIKERAFEDCGNLKSVTIGNSVTSIGSSAFEGCSSLTSINIPDSVTSIGNSAFEGCSGLTSVTIPDSVTSIGAGAFSGCLIETATIPASACKHIKNSSLKIVVVTSGESISEEAFSQCSGLTSVTIPNSVTSIGAYAFEGCRGLTSITIPDSVTSIGSYAFYGCDGLTSITIPDSVTSIGYDAFYGCLIETANIPAFACSYIKCSSLETVVITSGENIEDYAFYDCSGLTSITIPDGVTSIGSSAFYGCDGLTNIYYTGDIASWCGISGLDNIMSSSRTLYIDGKKVEGELIIPDSVTSIVDGAFAYCSGLTSVTIGNSVTSIGSSAFYGCSRLTNIYYIGDIASWCRISGLNEIMSGSRTLYIGGNKLEGELVIPDGVTSIVRYAFYNCSGLTSVTIGSSVTSIGDYAFSDCSGLTSITIPDSVTSIGYGAFYNCSGLTNIYYTGNIASWCGISGLYFLMSSSRTLYIGGNKLEGELVIPDGVTSIGSSAFYGCSGLTSITIPDSVTSIDDYAFRDCSSLTSVTIPDSVTSIGRYAFYGCSGLTSVTYNGTMEQWNAISKDSDWNYNTGSYIVHCTDGDIAK